jgi:hypothetical protein
MLTPSISNREERKQVGCGLGSLLSSRAYVVVPRARTRRRTIDAPASATAVTHNITIFPRAHPVPDAGKLIPVTTVNQAAKHNGHFGSSSIAAPVLVARESRRARRRDGRPPPQHWRAITHLPRAWISRRCHSASHIRRAISTICKAGSAGSLPVSLPTIPGVPVESRPGSSR